MMNEVDFIALDNLVHLEASAPPLRVVQYRIKACDKLGTFIYLPGETDYVGNIVPVGVKEVWTVTY